MTASDIRDAIQTFAKYGVPKERIFNEVMRARYLDYVLFLNPTNVQYGISIDDLYENMKKTADKLGLYEGDADTYAKVYTLALRVEPMAFAPHVLAAGEEIHSLLQEAIKKAQKGGNTILFAGADGYLPFLDEAFKELGGKRIAVAVKEKTWKERLQLVFPRGRAMMMEVLDSDTEHYDYIFCLEEHHLAKACEMMDRLSPKGMMDLLISYDVLQEDTKEAALARKTLASSRKLAYYYDTEIHGKEYAFLRFQGEEVKTLTFGESGFADGTFFGYDQLTLPMDAFIEAEDWNYDLYAYNGAPAIQMLLSGNVVQVEHNLTQGFEEVQKVVLPKGSYEVLPKESITASGVRVDLLSTTEVEGEGKALSLQSGDLVLTVYDDKIHTSIVPSHIKVIADEGILAFRPVGKYTAEYLKLYLDGPVGHLFLDTMKAGNTYHLTAFRILRIPLPKANEECIAHVTHLCQEKTHALYEAEEAWREAKRNGVGLMMGQK